MLSEQQPTVAVLSLLPDSGHVRPLLRLARVLQKQVNCRVVCLLPSKFESVVGDYGFDFKPLRSETTALEGGLAQRLSCRTIFYNAFSNYMDLWDSYWVPLAEVVSHELESLVGTLRDLNPQFLLVDVHMFSDWYERLACACNARLIVHDFEGTLRGRRSVFVGIYGLTDRERWLQAVVELAGLCSQAWFRFWRRVRYAKRARNVEAMKTAIKRREAVALGKYGEAKPDAIHVTSGLARLEVDFAGIEASGATSAEVILGPTVEPTAGELHAELTEWLAKHVAGEVVYVCFGTMIALSDAMIEELARGLVAADLPVIWSLPASQQRLVRKQYLVEKIRFEVFVPQIALLASGKIGCFVTHGGSSSAQEAAVCGTPVLCIPFMWDQPYNASVLAALGIGKVMPKGRIEWRRISNQVREIIHNPTYTDSAKRLAGALRSLQNSELQAEGIRRLTTEVR